MHTAQNCTTYHIHKYLLTVCIQKSVLKSYVSLCECEIMIDFRYFSIPSTCMQLPWLPTHVRIRHSYLQSHFYFRLMDIECIYTKIGRNLMRRVLNLIKSIKILLQNIQLFCILFRGHFYLINIFKLLAIK